MVIGRRGNSDDAPSYGIIGFGRPQKASFQATEIVHYVMMIFDSFGRRLLNYQRTRPRKMNA